jgi:hypothetical protein
MYLLEFINIFNHHGFILKTSEIIEENENIRYIELSEDIVNNIIINESGEVDYDYNIFILEMAKKGKPSFNNEGSKTEFFEEVKNLFYKSNKKLTEKISKIKNKLDSTDYQVIKCYEASLLNEEMPYDLQELLAQRKAWRDEINALEFEISMLG